MVFMDHFRVVRLPHVESVAFGILTSDNEVHWLLGVPADSRRFVFKIDLVDRGVASDVVQADSPVHSHTREDVYLRRIKFDFSHSVYAPIECLQRG